MFAGASFRLLSKGSEVISRQSLLLLEHLEGLPHELPPRCNVSLLANEEWIAHYIEGEMREARGETRGCLGWPQPRIKQVRGHLKGLRNALETVRKKWAIEENEIEAKRKQLTEEIVAKVLKSEERRKAFEARWNEVKERNKKALGEGTFAGPIVPIGWVPPEARKKKGSEAEAKAEKVSFLHLLDEEPEGRPRVSEGAPVAPVDPLLLRPPCLTSRRLRLLRLRPLPLRLTLPRLIRSDRESLRRLQGWTLRPMWRLRASSSLWPSLRI